MQNRRRREKDNTGQILPAAEANNFIFLLNIYRAKKKIDKRRRTHTYQSVTQLLYFIFLVVAPVKKEERSLQYQVWRLIFPIKTLLDEERELYQRKLLMQKKIRQY